MTQIIEDVVLHQISEELISDHYYVHYVHSPALNLVRFAAYYAAESDGEYLYTDDKDSSPVDSAENAEVAFAGTCQNRGDIETRIYPGGTDQEWWGEQFIDNAKLLKDCILPYCEKVLK